MRARKAALVLFAAIFFVAAFVVWERIAFDRAAWNADYDQLRAHVSRNYANLLWVIDRRGLDPVELHRATVQKLENAHTDREARTAIASFISAFQDGHFRIDRTPLSRRLESFFMSEAQTLGADTSPQKACAALGFRGEDEGLAFGDADLRPRDTPDNSFSTGLLQVGGKTAGMVRIPIFDPKRYRGACERAWHTHVGARPCDRACVEGFVTTAVPNQILSEFAGQIRGLAGAGAEILVVDVTKNGGGTDWVDAAARVVARKPFACAPVSFIKGPHWTKTFVGIRPRSKLTSPQPKTRLTLRCFRLLAAAHSILATALTQAVHWTRYGRRGSAPPAPIWSRERNTPPAA